MLKITEFISKILISIYISSTTGLQVLPKSTDCLLRLAAAIFNSYRVESKRGCEFIALVNEISIIS